MPTEVPATETDGTATVTDSATDNATPPADNAAQPDGTDALGDAGKRALDAMKGKWHTERDQRRALEARIAELEAPKTDDGAAPDVEAIRAAAVREATSAANARVVRAEIKAAAAGKVVNPELAMKLLDTSGFEVNEDGSVDADEISDAITALLTEHPYLAATAQGGTRFQDTGDGGARKANAGPIQLTRADIAGMSPEQIVAAKAAGQMANLLSGK